MREQPGLLQALTLPPLLLILTVCPGATAAAGVYDEPKGRYAIDLPGGWAPASTPNELVTVFQGGDEDQVRVAFYPAAAKMDREAILAEAYELCTSDGLTDLAPEGAVFDLTISGNPARYGVYRGYKLGDTVLTIYALIGAVELEKGGVSFRAYFHTFNRKKLQGKLEKMFLSIRDAEQPPGGAAGRSEAVRVPAVAGEEARRFDHEYGSLALPPGWQAKELGRNFEKEVVGWFMSDEIPGASVLAVCYRGFGMTMAKTEVAARRTVEASLPNAVPARTPGFIISDRGEEAATMTYTGSSVSAGQRLEMKAMTATIKTEKCKLAIIGFVASRYWREAQLDMVRMVRSAQ